MVLPKRGKSPFFIKYFFCLTDFFFNFILYVYNKVYIIKKLRKKKQQFLCYPKTVRGPKKLNTPFWASFPYKQPGKVAFSEEHKSNTNGNRGKFSTEKFAKKYGLGDPVAGNFFQAKFDESVPELHKQLG
jgi:hypothetical protein